ncbi:MAG TPA: hypothetical protein PLQ76_05915, partial [bacterium]|nr:hypothetical protein [bacterium]
AELVSENSKENGVESNILTPGVSYSYNGRDYVFVGAAYDFGASEWNTLDMDYIYRAGDGLRFVYSMRRDLMNDVFTAQTFNLQADFFKGTFILGFEDESSEFWAGYFLDNKMGTSGRSLFSRWNGGSR